MSLLHQLLQPAEAEALRAELAEMLPHVPLASVLVEVDARTGFTDHLVHAGGKAARPAELKRNLLFVIIAEAITLFGPTASRSHRAEDSGPATATTPPHRPACWS